MYDYIYSIIIPHKNIPDLLMRCLRSIPVREDIQVIVVDDNSDGADSYLDTYSDLRRPYLEFYATKDDKGAGYARNVGMAYAKGKWLLFVDADDFLTLDAFDVLDQYAESKNDIVYFRPKAVQSDDCATPARRNTYITKLFDDFSNDGDDRYLRTEFCTPWSKLVSRNFVLKVDAKFEEIPYSNDFVFFTIIGTCAKHVEIAERTFYVVTERQLSLTSNFCAKKGELDCRASAYLRATFIARKNGYKKNYSELTNYAQRLFGKNWLLYCAFFRICRMNGLTDRKIFCLICDGYSLKGWCRVVLTTYILLLFYPSKKCFKDFSKYL